MSKSNQSLTTPEGVKQLMSSSKNENEWNSNVDLVKDANNGYPSFWYQEVILSGLSNSVAETFGMDSDIHIS